MAHKTMHRKNLEAHQKEIAKLRAAEVQALQESTRLKPFVVQEVSKSK